MVIVTHDPDIAAYTPPRVLTFRDGECIEDVRALEGGVDK